MFFKNYEAFLKTIKNDLEKRELSFYLFNLVIKKEKWERFDKIINKYSSDRRNRWNLRKIDSEEPDFFILEFKNIEDFTKINVYVKIIQKISKYILLRAFSTELSDITESSIVSFVNYSTGFWMANLDSEFLINIEKEFKKIDPDYWLKYLQFFINDGKTTHNIYNPEGLKEFFDLQDNIVENKGLFSILKRFKAIIYKENQELLRFSIGDDCKLYMESGNFSIFSILLEKIEQNIIKVLKNYNLEIDYEIDELIKEKERFRVLKRKSIDQIIYTSKEFKCEDWFDRLTKLFSNNVFANYYFLMIEQGNPYLLLKIIDINSGEIIFCSATKDILKITPSSENVSGETIVSFLKLIQTEVGIQV